MPQADSLLTIDKAAVASRFNRSAETYDDHCRVQRLMADRLACSLEGVAAPARILEIGCGTGYLTGLLATRFPTSKIVALDFAARMVEIARNRVRGGLVDLEVADAETAAFDPGSFGLIVSNATIQWFATPGESLARLAAALRPGGLMLHTTFGPETFTELRSILRSNGLPLRPADRWTSMFAESGLERVRFAAGSVTVTYPGAAGFLAELSATGATWRPSGSDDPPLPPRFLRSAMARYDAEFATPEGVPVTYELLEVSGSRPGKTI